MHPDITRELVRARQMDLSRGNRHRAERTWLDADGRRRGKLARRRHLRSLRSALRHRAA